MRVREIMSTAVMTVPPDMTIKEVASLLANRRINAAPVLDAGRLVGIVSERDLIPFETMPDPRLHLIVAPSSGSASTTVAEVMTRLVVTMPADADVADVARAMIEADVRQIPIVQGSELVGIVARRDLLRVLARSDVEIESDAQALLDEFAELIGPLRAHAAGGVVAIEGSPDVMACRLAERLVRGVTGVVAVAFVRPVPAAVPPWDTIQSVG